MRATGVHVGLMAPVGGMPIPFTVEGPATDPIFRPDMKGIAKEELSNAVGKASGLLQGLLGGKKQ